MRIALLADIHSNLLALEAVRRDLRQAAPDAVYLLGDQVNRCPWPNEVVELVSAEGWPAIYGNHDLVVRTLLTPEIIHPFDERPRFRCLWWTAETLTPGNMAALNTWPAERCIELPEGPPIRLLHGIPGNTFAGVTSETPPAGLERVFGEVTEPVVVVAHTHRQLDRVLERPTGRLHIFNPGSVGMPYNEDPRAQYMVLDSVRKEGVVEWQPTFRRVDYDRDALRPAFVRSGMMAELGATAELHLRTALTGHAYSSDFGYWLKDQPREVREDPDAAVPVYLAQHGPGRWAFQFAAL